MQVRHLRINNFRGIASLDWTPMSSFCCLIGSGDSGKSTVLDAIEAALSSRWFTFTEPDFIDCDTTKSICIEATIGELSKALKSDERFGLFIRGWTMDVLRDEPTADDEPVLTVRLSVDATMEPVWELVCDRTTDTRILSNRDRALFGLVRLAGEDARHLGWGQGSVLSRLTGDTKEASARLAEAYKTARASANLDSITALTDAAAAAEEFAKNLGAYVQNTYGPGLELGRAGLSSGSIALHDGGVPLRLAGLGTRRLATLAIQKSAITEGAIVLVDEIEHGLEPHRIIGALSQLKADQDAAHAGGKPVGQVLMTTHSDVALGELDPTSLRVVQKQPVMGITQVHRPNSPDPLRAFLRYTPRALFAKRILVCEGHTEVGILLGIRGYWPARHHGRPIEQIGAAIADGNGGQAIQIATGLSALGYSVGLYRDSDVPLPVDQAMQLTMARVKLIEYGSSINTEQAIFGSADTDYIQALIEHLRAEHTADSVDSSIRAAIPDLPLATVRELYGGWHHSSTLTEPEIRAKLAEIAGKKKWFKSERAGRAVAPILWEHGGRYHPNPLSNALLAAENWLYG